MKKILLSARDPGAALNILALYKVLEKDSSFRPHLVASRPAIDIIRDYGEDPEPFVFTNRRNDSFLEGDDLNPLLTKTEGILDKYSPDLVLTGLSSFGAGVDEALILKSKAKTVLYQDFWGDLNPFFNKYPDLVLCLDNFAVNLTIERFANLACKIVGFPKMELLKKINIEELRKHTRSSIKVSEKNRVITWFGQSPEIPGHNKIIKNALSHIAKIKDDNLVILLRGHPKFNDDINNIYDFSIKLCLNVINITDFIDPIPWLVSSDLLLTPFSSCGIDHAALSFLSDKPIGQVIYLLNDKRLKEYYNNISGLGLIPLSDIYKIGTTVYSDFNCENIINKENDYFRNVKKKFINFEYETFIDCLKEYTNIR